MISLINFSDDLKYNIFQVNDCILGQLKLKKNTTSIFLNNTRLMLHSDYVIISMYYTYKKSFFDS